MIEQIFGESIDSLSYEESRVTARQIIDVRSPSEFEMSHIPGSVNIPLFTDEERSLIGILYKKAGKEVSVKEGFNIVKQRTDQLLEAVINLKIEGKIGVACARGGMRSKAMTSFLKLNGVNTFQLSGGLKSYRKWVLDSISDITFPNEVYVIHGLTGTGKSETLRKLPNIIDLEELANHKSSLFGGIAKSPVSQKNFENLLQESYLQIDKTKPVFIEGESIKIGSLFIPINFYRLMRRSRKILLECETSNRIQNIIHDYSDQLEMAGDEFKKAILSLNKSLGNSLVASIVEEFDKRNYELVVEELLRSYYDHKYKYCYQTYQFDAVVKSDDPQKAANQILKFVNCPTNISIPSDSVA